MDENDRAFLRWCHERFAVVFGESPNLDWMQRLAALAKTPDPATERPVRRSRAPGCATCDRDPGRRQMMPPHDASERCESGKHPHCSCDTCF